MDKKQTMLRIIEQFQKQADHPPAEISESLKKIKEKLESMSSYEVELLDGPVSTPAQKQPSEENNPVYMLYNTYSDIEEFAYSGKKSLTSIMLFKKCVDYLIFLIVIILDFTI